MNEQTTDLRVQTPTLMLVAKVVARIISAIFHPLLMPTYMLALLLMVNPYLFGVSGLGDLVSRLLLIRIFLSTFFIPMIAISMLKLTGLVQTYELLNKQERIGPYIITGIFYIWMFRNFLENPQIPTAYTTFMLGCTIALFLAFFINIFSRISAHTVGMGALVGMVLITLWQFSYDTFHLGSWELNMKPVLIVTILAAGLVGTARQALHKYEVTDLYGGYIVGLFSQFIALRFLF
ncbi:MAG: hypothetical protein ACK4TA_19845 [Saprospiraceae bacterium]